MKFMLMMFGTKAGFESMCGWAPEEISAHIRFMKDLAADLKESGDLVLAEGLDLPSTTKIVTAKDPGSPAVTDGPFPESKEFLAGFWIIECSEERAIEIAARASSAPGPGGRPLGFPIEMRPVGEAPPDM